MVHTLPYLTQVSDEEWLPLEAFQKLYSTWNTEGAHCLGLYNVNDELKNCKPGPWKVKYTGEDEWQNVD